MQRTKTNFLVGEMREDKKKGRKKEEEIVNNDIIDDEEIRNKTLLDGWMQSSLVERRAEKTTSIIKVMILKNFFLSFVKLFFHIARST